jgi:quercetin dioxygenase-like cupin family protein
MRRRRVAGIALIALSLASMVGAVAVATPLIDVTVEPVAAATVARDFRINQGDGLGVVIARFTIAPGGTTGWHTHPGQALVAVQSGELTLYRSVDGECRRRTFGPGEGFVEIPTVVHMAQNEGDVPLVFGATLFRIPASGVARIDQPDPGVCST